MKKQVNVRIRIPIEKGKNQHMIKRSVFAYFEKEPDVMKQQELTKLQCFNGISGRTDMPHMGRVKGAAVNTDSLH